MKRILYTSVAVILVLLCVAGCIGKPAVNGSSYNLYFSNAERNNLVVETRNVDAGNSLEIIAENIAKELIKGPQSASNYGVLPVDTRVLSVEIKDNTANIDFSKGYFPKGENAEIQELLARYSIVNTLCDIEGIDKVKIFIEGAELVNSSNVPVGALGKEDIMINSTTFDIAKQETLILYFPDNQAEYLVEEARTVALIDNSVEKTVVTELVKGTQNKDLMSTIPAETKVISVETKDGICFVNLSSEFITKHSQGSTAEVFTVYSIVNSLTELPGVNRVQFLIEGKKAEVLKHMLLDSPFTRSEEYMQK